MKKTLLTVINKSKRIFITIFNQKNALFCLLALIPSYTIFSMEQSIITSKGINNKSLDTLYTIGDIYKGIGKKLYIPQEELIDSDGNPINLKELFEKHSIHLGWPDTQPKEKDWGKAYSQLLQRAKGGKTASENNSISLDELSRILLDAKTLIKNFLINKDRRLPPHYVKKTIGILNRLFTYSKLEQVIKEKYLTHVRLPLKILVIQDKNTGKYISSKESPEIIDTILKVYFNDLLDIVAIGYDNTRYNLIVFAQEEINEGGFNRAAREELSILCKEVPFDVGYDNIFANDKGDAVIVDTEFKGEQANTACSKLDRYPVLHQEKSD